MGGAGSGEPRPLRTRHSDHPNSHDLTGQDRHHGGLVQVLTFGELLCVDQGGLEKKKQHLNLPQTGQLNQRNKTGNHNQCLAAKHIY